MGVVNLEFDYCFHWPWADLPAHLAQGPFYEHLRKNQARIQNRWIARLEGWKPLPEFDSLTNRLMWLRWPWGQMVYVTWRVIVLGESRMFPFDETAPLIDWAFEDLAPTSGEYHMACLYLSRGSKKERLEAVRMICFRR